VIAIGEMRDYDTIKTALTAAETGVLVLSTLHIISIDKIVERLLAYAPDGSDGHMRALLPSLCTGSSTRNCCPPTTVESESPVKRWWGRTRFETCCESVIRITCAISSPQASATACRP